MSAKKQAKKASFRFKLVAAPIHGGLLISEHRTEERAELKRRQNRCKDRSCGCGGPRIRFAHDGVLPPFESI